MSARAERRIELGRYRISAGERALVAQRIHGRVAVVDIPIDHAGRVHLVERQIHSRAELAELCAAYLEHSREADRPAIVAERDLLDELARGRS